MDRQSLLDDAATAYATGKLAAAEAGYRSILALIPCDAETLSNLAAVLNATQRHEAAETACRAALQAHPRYWAALANLGNALHRQQRHAEAVNAYHAAIEANPRNAGAWSNLGVALNEQQKMADSLVAHNAAVTLAPHDAQIRTNRAMALLMDGDFARGFAEFEWRWRTPGMAPHGFDTPQWMGGDAAGKTILLHSEGGFGDTLQFIRYAPELAARGAHVIARVQPPLITLLQRSMPTIDFIPDTRPAPAHDMHCPMLSLPHAWGTGRDTIQAGIPYLTADPEKRGHWRKVLAALRPARVIGLAWAGAPLLGMSEFRAMNTRRSIRADALMPLAGMRNTAFVSLQLGASELPFAMLDPMPLISDFDDTAAIIANLDLVIVVDTAIAHLAGALGRPVRLMSRYDACWRWLANRKDSPWYPTLKVYRQTVAGDWPSVIKAIVEED
jgi:hypothetical protein